MSDARGTVDGIRFYRRRGCGFCVMLHRRLDELGVPMVTHDIWADPDAAEFVRRHADGNETVPTVAVGEQVLVNPSAGEVLAAMADEMPDLLEGIEAPEPGRSGEVRRLFSR